MLNQPNNNRNIVVHGELQNQAPEQDYTISIFLRLFMSSEMHQTLFWNRGRVEYVNGHQKPIQLIQIKLFVNVMHLNPRFEAETIFNKNLNFNFSCIYSTIGVCTMLILIFIFC